MKLKLTLAFLAIATVLFGAVSEFKGDGLTMKFNPSNNFAGFNYGSNATDPTTLFNADAWYNSTTHLYKGRVNGVTKPFVLGDTSTGGNGAADDGKVAIYGFQGQLVGSAGNGNTAVSGQGTQYGGYFTGDVRGLVGDSGIGTGITAQSSSGTYIFVARDEGAEIDRLLIRRTDGAIVYNGGVTVTPAATSGAMLTSGSALTLPAVYPVAISDEVTDLTTGTAKITFRMPYAMTLTSVRASAGTAPTGSTIIVDINEAGSTIMTTTKLSIDATEKTSTTAAAPAALTDTSLADDAEITIDIDQIGSTVAGKGLKVVLIGTRTFTP